MQILIGDGSGKRLKRICEKHGIGRMLCTNWPELYEGEPWGFDNGAWGFRDEGWTPDNEGKWLVRLNRAMKLAQDLNPPYMAVLPDIVAGGDKSLKLSVSWIGKLPEWQWYLAVQDGMTVAKVIDTLDRVDGIFLGGSDAYKKYAGYWCKTAHHLGKKFHYGRAGTLNKLAHAIAIKADSLDSAFPLWTKDRLWSFIQAVGQPVFDFPIFAPHPGQGEGALVQL